MTASKNNRDLTLIVVDSDSETRSAIKEAMAKNRGRVIAEAEDTKAGLRLVRGLQPDVVLLELPASASDVIDVIKIIRDELPGTGIITSSRESSPQLILSCIRAGAQEFVARPIDAGELTKAIDHVRRLLGTIITSGRKRGSIVSVFSGKGGIGATSVTANLGVALANRSDDRVVLVDMSFQMGDLGLMLDSPPRCNLTDAFEDGRLDDAGLRSMLVQHTSGVYLLTVVSNLEIAEEINRHHIVELFGTLSTLFDYVVVDVGRHLDDRTVEVLELSQAILLMSSMDLPTNRNVSRYLDIFDRLKIDRDKMHLVVNRFHKKGRITPGDIEEALQMDVFWKIPNDFQPMSLAIDGGTPAVIEAPRSKVARSFFGLADCLCDVLEEEESSLEPVKASAS